MSLPKYSQMYWEFLDSLLDGQPHEISQIRAHIVSLMKLSAEDLSERLQSGQLCFANRTGWTATYLLKAGQIVRIKRGVYQITAAGLETLQGHGRGTLNENAFLDLPSFRAFLNSSKIKNADKKEQPSLFLEETPQDAIELAMEKINFKLAEDLLAEIMRRDASFFEHLAVSLLLRMGYGSAGMTIGHSGDEGIDGIISEDKLGFDQIYIQAKKWDPSVSSIGRPEIQKFVGALAGQGASKGLFITTAKFSCSAIEYVKKQHTVKIILIDGALLTQLMIEYNLGVSPESTYEVKKLDSDYFSDEDE